VTPVLAPVLAPDLVLFLVPLLRPRRSLVQRSTLPSVCSSQPSTHHVEVCSSPLGRRRLADVCSSLSGIRPCNVCSSPPFVRSTSALIRHSSVPRLTVSALRSAFDRLASARPCSISGGRRVAFGRQRRLRLVRTRLFFGPPRPRSPLLPRSRSRALAPSLRVSRSLGVRLSKRSPVPCPLGVPSSERSSVSPGCDVRSVNDSLASCLGVRLPKRSPGPCSAFATLLIYLEALPARPAVTPGNGSARFHVANLSDRPQAVF